LQSAFTVQAGEKEKCEEKYPTLTALLEYVAERLPR
jgi:hypothetical protein